MYIHVHVHVHVHVDPIMYNVHVHMHLSSSRLNVVVYGSRNIHVPIPHMVIGLYIYVTDHVTHDSFPPTSCDQSCALKHSMYC